MEKESWGPDRAWSEEQWRELLEGLINDGIVTWREVTGLVLGQMNPPQVGTSLASNKEVQAFSPPRQTWQAVRAWLYAQNGTCEQCGSRLDLQVDHITPKELGGDCHLDNFQLLCRRCNVGKRPSHKNAGLTFLSAESALMWLLFVYQPETYEDFEALCRRYGLTMASIRFQEAWAMALWLKKVGLYPPPSLRAQSPHATNGVAEPLETLD